MISSTKAKRASTSSLAGLTPLWSQLGTPPSLGLSWICIQISLHPWKVRQTFITQGNKKRQEGPLEGRDRSVRRSWLTSKLWPSRLRLSRLFSKTMSKRLSLLEGDTSIGLQRNIIMSSHLGLKVGQPKRVQASLQASLYSRKQFCRCFKATLEIWKLDLLKKKSFLLIYKKYPSACLVVSKFYLFNEDNNSYFYSKLRRQLFRLPSQCFFYQKRRRSEQESG
jgi:hypothetical protein